MVGSNRDRTGDDPTRREPGGSGTTSKITEESELGSDRASDEGGNESGGRDTGNPGKRTR